MKYNGIIAFIGGALVGAAAAVLMAPDSGENTRRKLRERAQQEYDNLKQKASHTKFECDTPYGGCE